MAHCEENRSGSGQDSLRLLLFPQWRGPRFAAFKDQVSCAVFGTLKFAQTKRAN
jgi:hypothetical protein